MEITAHGNWIFIDMTPSDYPNSNLMEILLPDGYTYSELFTLVSSNVSYLSGHQKFPIVDGKSPNKLFVYINDLTINSRIYVEIEKFGLEPCPNYFDIEFEPILVTNEMGEEYNVIPSTQFK